MNLSDRAIERPRLIILFTLLICGLGLMAIFNLPKERTPRVRVPVIIVAVPNPGSQPAVNERDIIKRIEDATGEIEDLKSEGGVRAQAVHGAAVMQFTFDDGVEVGEAKEDVRNVVDQVKGQFPEKAQNDPGPSVIDIAFDDFPIIQVFVSGGEDGQQRRQIAERLRDRIEKLPGGGVAGVDIFGGLEEEVHVEANPHLLTLYGFTYDDVAAAIVSATDRTPSGAIEGDAGTEMRVDLDSQPRKVEDISRIAVGLRDGKPILVGDVARVSLAHKPVKSIARYGQADATVILVRAKTDVDVMATAENVQALVDQFVADGMGESTTIGTVRSQAREIKYMMWQLGTSALYGSLLVFILLLLFLGLRNATLIVIAVPFAVLAAFAILWIAKHTVNPELAINNMVLFALILVTGMVVDGCIIVGENIFRHRELGTSPIEASKRGVHEVGASLICAYLTTFAAFGPMYIMRGIMGDFMSVLPTVVLFALVAAMLVDHFLLPALSVYFMKVPQRKLAKAKARAEELHTEEMSPHERELVEAESLVERSRIKRTYGSMIRYALHHRILVLVLAAIVSITPVGLFAVNALGFEFFPESDVPIVEVYFELPLGSSMETRTLEVAKQIEDATLKAVRPEEWFRPSENAPRVKPVTTIGEPGALNINFQDTGGTGPEFGMVYVELELAENRERTAAEIRKAIAAAIPPLPGVIVRVKSPTDGPPAGAPISVRVLGHENSTSEMIARRAAEVEEILRGIPGTYDHSTEYNIRPEIKVEPNDVVASMYDLTKADINRNVNYALEGVRLAKVDFGGDEEIDIRLRSLRSEADEVRDLTNLPIRSRTGKLVTLDQVAKIDRVWSPNIIHRYDKKRVVTLRTEIEEGVLTDTVKRKLVEALRPDLSRAQQRELTFGSSTLVSDDEVVIEFGGENEVRDDAVADLKIAMAIAAGVMMIILTIQFNSFVQPLIILFSVPLSIVGVAIGLMICGLHFSVSAMIGVVALAGIVVNDAIVLVDFINRLREAGVSMEKAVVLAGQLRLRPIFITTITTIGGLMPLALNLAGGGEFWQPLTVTIMFGLGFATLLQLFIIPLACYTFSREGKASLLDPTLRTEYSGPTVAPA